MAKSSAKKKIKIENAPISISMTDIEAVRFANACEHCISKEEGRYYLQGVFLEYSEKDGLQAVATDGHRLAMCKVTAEIECESGSASLAYILPREAIDWILSIKNPDGSAFLITIDQIAKTAKLERSGHAFTAKFIDGQYPKWRKLWDDAAKECYKKPTAFFNVNYLNDIAKAATKMGGGSSKNRIGLVFHRKSPSTSPLIVETPDNGVHYLLMPMRGDHQ